MVQTSIQPPRIVDPRLYTRNYYLSEAEGWDFFPYATRRIFITFWDSMNLANVKDGMNILDIGCGRGEILYNLSHKINHGVGVDYSVDGINLSNNLMAQLPEPFSKKIELYCDDINNVLPKLGKFDRVFLLDFVEHLYPEQLEVMYKELIDKHLNHGAIMIIKTPIADAEWERHYFLPNTKQKLMHVNINSFENHIHYFNEKMYVERLSKYYIRATLK